MTLDGSAEEDVPVGQFEIVNDAQAGSSPHSEDALQDASHTSGIVRVFVEVDGREVFIGNSDEVGPQAVISATRQAQEGARRISHALRYLAEHAQDSIWASPDAEARCAELEAILQGRDVLEGQG